MQRLQNFIAGELREVQNDSSIEIVEPPRLGTPYLEAPNSSDADVDAACSQHLRRLKYGGRRRLRKRSLALFRIG